VECVGLRTNTPVVTGIVWSSGLRSVVFQYGGSRLGGVGAVGLGRV
jgi:hypothetical protein